MSLFAEGLGLSSLVALILALRGVTCRDNVGLPGLAKYFKDGSDEEKDHTQMLITFQV